MPPVYFHGNCNRYKKHTGIVWWSKLSTTKCYFSTVAIISCALSPVVNNSLLAALVNICTSEATQCITAASSTVARKILPTQSNFHCPNFFFCLYKHSAGIDECQWVQFFPHGGIRFHTSASYALPCQTPFCQAALLMQSVAWQLNVISY